MALAGFAALPARCAAMDDPTTTRARRLGRLVTSPRAARRVAQTYLAEIGHHDSRRAAQMLGVDSVLAPLDGIADIRASREFLGARIRADFAAGAVIDVAGWRLSRTEVGACLLVASSA
jgi:hypothetical protein